MDTSELYICDIVKPLMKTCLYLMIGSYKMLYSQFAFISYQLTSGFCEHDHNLFSILSELFQLLKLTLSGDR